LSLEHGRQWRFRFADRDAIGALLLIVAVGFRVRIFAVHIGWIEISLVKSGHNVGKTHCAAVAVNWWMRTSTK
jgi:hypothetical protein